MRFRCRQRRARIHRSKNAQEGKGAVVYLGRPTMGRLTALIGRAGIAEGAFLRQVDKGGRSRFSGSSLYRIVQVRARAVASPAACRATPCGSATLSRWPPGGPSLFEMQRDGRSGPKNV